MQQFSQVACLICILSWAPVVWGQQLTADQQPATETGQEVSAPPAAVLGGEITVTAQKREASLRDVPMSLSVLSAEDLESLRLDSSSEIAAQTTHLEIKQSFAASNPMIFLRGVGLNDFNSNASSAVGFYADEVYLSSPTGQVLEFFDLERVEVLRGPQGTLFGKNTTGGAVQLVTRKPSGQNGGHLRLGWGRFDQLDVEGGAEVASAEGRVALRLAANLRQRDGITRNLVNGNDENDIDARAARLQLRWLANDRLSLRWAVDGGANRSAARQYQSQGLFDGRDALGYGESHDPFTGSYDRPTRADVDTLGASMTVIRSGSSFDLTSISAWRQADRLVLEDTDASPNALLHSDWSNDSEQFSQELRLTSKSGGDVDWIAGLFYFDESLEVENFFDVLGSLRPFGIPFNPPFSPFGFRQVYSQDTTTWAPFGQLTYRLADHLTLRAGARFTREEKDLRLDTAFVEPSFEVPAIVGLERDVDASEVSGDLGLSWQPRPGLLLWGALSRGFKSGGFNGGARFVAAEATPVDPEFVTSYEFGWRSESLERRLRLAASAFYYDYTDLQVFDIDATGGLPVEVLDNASDARVTGLEIELEARPAAGLDLRLGLGWLDAEYQSYVRADGLDFSGNRLIAAPEWSANGRLGYSKPLGERGTLRAFADFSYVDDRFLDPANLERLASAAHSLWNGRLAFDAPGAGRWSVALWGKNLADEVYVANSFSVADFGFDALVIGDPRTYGFDLALRFD